MRLPVKYAGCRFVQPAYFRSGGKFVGKETFQTAPAAL
jgi:hypothetical protein